MSLYYVLNTTVFLKAQFYFPPFTMSLQCRFSPEAIIEAHQNIVDFGLSLNEISETIPCNMQQNIRHDILYPHEVDEWTCTCPVENCDFKSILSLCEASELLLYVQINTHSCDKSTIRFNPFSSIASSNEPKNTPRKSAEQASTELVSDLTQLACNENQDITTSSFRTTFIDCDSLDRSSDNFNYSVTYDLDFLQIYCKLPAFQHRIELFYNPKNMLRFRLKPSMPSYFDHTQQHSKVAMDLLIGTDTPNTQLQQQLFLVLPKVRGQIITKSELCEKYMEHLSTAIQIFLDDEKICLTRSDMPASMKVLQLKSKTIKDRFFDLFNNEANLFCNILHNIFVEDPLFAGYQICSVKYGQKYLLTTLSSDSVATNETLEKRIQSLDSMLFSNYSNSHVSLLSYAIARQTNVKSSDYYTLVGKKAYFDNVKAKINDNWNDQDNKREVDGLDKEVVEYEEAEDSENLVNTHLFGSVSFDDTPSQSPLQEDHSLHIAEECFVEQEKSFLESFTTHNILGTKNWSNMTLKYKRSLKYENWKDLTSREPFLYSRQVYSTIFRVFRDSSGRVFGEDGQLTKKLIKISQYSFASVGKSTSFYEQLGRLRQDCQLRDLFLLCNLLANQRGGLRDEEIYFCDKKSKFFDHIFSMVNCDNLKPGVDGDSSSFAVVDSLDICKIARKNFDQIKILLCHILQICDTPARITPSVIELFNFMEFFVGLVQHGFGKNRLRILMDLFKIEEQQETKNFSYLDYTEFDFHKGQFRQMLVEKALNQKCYIQYHASDKSKKGLFLKSLLLCTASFNSLDLNEAETLLSVLNLLLDSLKKLMCCRLNLSEMSLQEKFVSGDTQSKVLRSSCAVIKLYFLDDEIKCPSSNFAALRLAFQRTLNKPNHIHLTNRATQFLTEVFQNQQIFYFPRLVERSILLRDFGFDGVDYNDRKGMYLDKSSAELWKLYVDLKVIWGIGSSKNFFQLPEGLIQRTKCETINSVNESIRTGEFLKDRIDSAIYMIIKKHKDLLVEKFDTEEERVIALLQFVMFHRRLREFPNTDRKVIILTCEKRMRTRYGIKNDLLQHLGLFSYGRTAVLLSDDEIYLRHKQQ